MYELVYVSMIFHVKRFHIFTKAGATLHYFERLYKEQRSSVVHSIRQKFEIYLWQGPSMGHDLHVEDWHNKHWNGCILIRLCLLLLGIASLHCGNIEHGCINSCVISYHFHSSFKFSSEKENNKFCHIWRESLWTRIRNHE